jgi:hypothetical protein
MVFKLAFLLLAALCGFTTSINIVVPIPSLPFPCRPPKVVLGKLYAPRQQRYSQMRLRQMRLGQLRNM